MTPPLPNIATTERDATDDGRMARAVSHARLVKPGFLIKLALIALANALGLYGVFAAWAVSQWLILVFSVATLAAINWTYFSRRRVAVKYLAPGLVFLFVYQIFAMVYTGYVAFTNYGTGHNSTKDHAIEAISAQNERRLEGSPSYPLAVVDRGDDLAFAVVIDGAVWIGADDEPLELSADATVGDDGRVASVPDDTVLTFGDIASRQSDVVNLRVPVSEDVAAGSIRTQDGSTGFVATPLLQYDSSTDTFVDAESGTVYFEGDRGNFVSDDGTVLNPGWRVTVGGENFTAMVTDSRMFEPFVRIFAWTFAFAAISVVTTFALGIFLAVTFNDPRVRGRKVYRALLILPYAFPGFLSALVWRGMMNERYGFINDVLLGGTSVSWLTDPTMAKISIILVNLWLGFPYMFLICTGALQAIPGEMVEAARIDGAGKWQIFRRLTMPWVLVATAPLLIASFAFNFNNFALIFMLTGGGPNFVGTPYAVGHTDILISMVYSIAIEGGTQQYGVASALSILIFIMVGLISWWGFRRTRSLEEI